MKTLMKIAAALGLGAVMSLPAQAREFGTPPVMPSGSTMGVPVGANPPVPGFYLSSRTALARGTAYDGDGNETPTGLDVNASALQLHWVPGFELWGGTYRAMGIVAYQDLSLSNAGTEIGSNTSISDFTISPLNVHWMTAPGIFVNAGISFSLPTGEFDTGPFVNGGNNVKALALDTGISYLRDGWNLSAHANYFVHGENDVTDYKSGDEFLLNLTAMKAISEDGWSVGAVGYYRAQVTEDKNNGAFYGGTTAGKLRESGVGIAVAKRFGPTEIYADYTWNVMAENTIGADMFRLNVTLPLGGK